MKIFEQNWGQGEDESGTTIFAEILPSGELLISGEDYGKSVELFKGVKVFLFISIKNFSPRFSSDLTRWA